MPRLRSRLGTRLVAAVAGTALLAGSVVGSVAVLQARAALREDILTSSLASAELAADQTLNYATDSAQGTSWGGRRRLTNSPRCRAAEHLPPPRSAVILVAC